MPERHPLQTTFEGGELSPYLYSRSDLPGYGKSAKQMVNVYPDTRGPGLSRNGAEFKQVVGDPADTNGRLFTFRVDYTTTYIVVVTETFVWITDRTNYVESDSFVVNGDFSSGSASWTTVVNEDGTVDFPASTAYLKTAAKSGSNALIRQQVTVDTALNNHKIRFSIPNIYGAGLSGLTAKLRVGTAAGLGDILETDFAWAGNYEFDFVPGALSFWVEVYTESGQVEQPAGGGEGGTILVWQAVDVIVDSISVVDIIAVPGGSNVTFPSVWNSDQINEMQVEMAPDLQEMYFVHREVPTQKLSLDNTVAPVIWTFAPVVFNWGTEPDPWTTEYPGAITFHQGRLLLAGTLSNPVTIWASKPGRDNYDDFDPGPKDQPDDAIAVTLARNADIQWIKGSKVLYVGCDNSEHVAYGNEGAVSVLDVNVDQQSVYGSSRHQAAWMSGQVMFISHDRRRVRLMEYASNSALIDSMDVSWMAEHLTEGFVTEIHQAANPINSMWAVKADGTLISCTLEKQFNALGWANHSIQGSVKSITVAEEEGTSVIYVLVYRDGLLRLERIGSKKNFMDEYIEVTVVTATDTVTGLDHLEGETVQCIADESYRGEYIVTGGQITVTGPEAIRFIVGLSMRRTLETMLVDGNIGGGSTARHKKRWNEITVRLRTSAVPLINGKREATRVPQDQMDVRAPLRTVDVTVHNLGWDTDGTILIEQDLPFDLQVVGVFGKLAEESL